MERQAQAGEDSGACVPTLLRTAVKPLCSEVRKTQQRTILAPGPALSLT